jgi:transcriptional repressor NrdR
LTAATKGRNVSAAQLTEIAGRVEESIRLHGSTVTSATVGLSVLDQLRSVDEVAYLRFASVYKDFDGASDFHRELALLEKSVTPT